MSDKQNTIRIAVNDLLIEGSVIESFSYNPAKDMQLMSERGIKFQDLIEVLMTANMQDYYIKTHHNPIKYSDQKVMHIKIKGHWCMVAYLMIDSQNIFLKTIYHSQKLNKLYGSM